MEADFSGYATKSGLRCSDGRIIMPNAFEHQDKMTIPLVWQHGHTDPANVLGHAVLENRADGVYAYGYFNETASAQNAKMLVEHGDINSMSIWANQLVEKAKQVFHGAIKEVSLVLSGANPGAKIDFINVAHSDGTETELDDEAIIFTGLELEHSSDAEPEPEPESENKETGEQATSEVTPDDKEEESETPAASDDTVETPEETVEHGDTAVKEKTLQEIYNEFTDEEKDVVLYMVGQALEEGASEAAHSDTTEEGNLNHQEGNTTMTNVFDQNGTKVEGPSLSHDQMKTIMTDADRLGSLKESFLQHAGEYGIDDIDVLFPDARLDQNGISIISRRMEWVQNVLSNTKHSPFSRVKSLAADLTADEARAKGYVKGSLKKDEIIKMLKRVTTPKTIYKKQKLDRDDILDITDIDIVAWLKAEMRVMLDEEIARAVLVGDGRDADDPDKIDEDHIRPIAYDIDMYTTKVNLALGITPADMIDAVVGALDNYKGTGTPTFFTTQRVLTQMLLSKDTLGRRFYATKADLAGALLVSDIVPVEAMEEDADLVGVLVNLSDYTIGADNGGNVSMFDDFDIDYNQEKYLIETRISGALTKPKSAVALFINSGRIVTATAPTFNATTGVVTIPAVTGVVYTNEDTGAQLAAGAQTAIAPGATVDIEAIPASGYGLTHGTDAEWSYTRNAS